MQFFTLRDTETNEDRYFAIVDIEGEVANLYDPEFSPGDALEPLATWNDVKDVDYTLEQLAEEFSRQDSDPSVGLYVSYKPIALVPQA